MRWPGILLAFACHLLAAPIAAGQEGGLALPMPPYDCALLERLPRTADELPYTSNAPSTGPILIPVRWFELVGVVPLDTQPELADALAEVDVTVRDADGNLVDGEPGSVSPPL